MQPFFLPIQIRDLFLIKALDQSKFESAPIFCSGIEICERALELGARNISFHQVSLGTLEQMREIPESVSSLARSFDALHSDLRTRHLGLDVPSLGWDFLNMTCIAQSVLDLQVAIPPFIEKLPSDGCPILFTCNNGQDLYFDSGLSRHTIRKLVFAKYKNLISLDITPPEIFRESANSFTLEIPNGSFRVLSHLPTVFYSIPFHQERLRQDIVKGLLDLESPYFDIPMSSNRILLRKCDRKTVSQHLNEYCQKLESLVSDFYETLNVSEEARLCGMVDRHLGWAVSQYEAYLSLCTAASARNVERVEISCHDTGLMGPLLSWANQRNISVEMWPHSEVISVPTPVLRKGRKNLYLSRPTLPLELGVGNSVWAGAKYRRSDSPKGKKTLLVLLNQMDSAGYLPRCRVLELKNGIECLMKRLSVDGWQIKIRHKPSHPYVNLMRLEGAQYAGGPLSDWLDWPEVCVSVPSPTTSIIRFWESGARCFHVQEIALGITEKVMLPNDSLKVYEGASFSDLFLRLANDLSDKEFAEDLK
jgi:hypothetical protein